MPLCCSNPPCGDLKQCSRSKKLSRKKTSSSSEKLVPFNEYIEIQTKPFLQLSSRKKQSSSSSSSSPKKRKKSKKSKQSKKVYQPKKSKLLTAALLASVMSPVNQNVNVQPRMDPVLGQIDPSIPENLISRRKHELKMQRKQMVPIQENQQIFEDEAFAEVLNEYKNNPRAIPNNLMNHNRPTYQETRDRLREKRMNNQKKTPKSQHKGRKKRKTKKKSKKH